jgi:hypothetical protein
MLPLLPLLPLLLLRLLPLPRLLLLRHARLPHSGLLHRTTPRPPLPLRVSRNAVAAGGAGGRRAGVGGLEAPGAPAERQLLL